MDCFLIYTFGVKPLKNKENNEQKIQGSGMRGGPEGLQRDELGKAHPDGGSSARNVLVPELGGGLWVFIF